MTANRPTMVILRALGLGDLLTVVPALRALATAFPDHRKVLATPAYLAPLADLTGAVDEVVDAAPVAPLDPALDRPAIAVNLQGRGPQSHRVVLRLRPDRLIAFAHPDIPDTRGFPEWRPGEHEVRRWCRLLEESGIAADPAALDLEPPAASVRPEAAGATVLHPGAKDPERRWPLDRWVILARTERQRGRPVIVTGSSDEAPIALEICRRAGLEETSALAGKTQLSELAGIVAAARVVVSADTGVAHMATAFGTPSVVLFGLISPAEWGPPPDRPQHRALWKGPRPGATAAEMLEAIQVDEVLDAIWGVAPEGASREIGDLDRETPGQAVAGARGEGEPAG